MVNIGNMTTSMIAAHMAVNRSGVRIAGVDSEYVKAGPDWMLWGFTALAVAPLIAGIVITCLILWS